MQCPVHNLELETVHGANVKGGVVCCCPVRGCHYARMPALPPQRPVQPKLPMQRGRQQNAVTVREEDLQRAIVTALRVAGYEVLITSRVRKRVQCQSCGEWGWMQGGDGCTPGLPDLLCWIPERRAWLGIEVKTPTGAVRPEQQRLAGEGKIVVVRSVEQALEAVGAEVRV